MSSDEFRMNPDEMPPFDPPGTEKVKPPKPRDAATLILVRGGREVMMGQRAKGHVFMPNKWVFPGGAVDPGDAKAPAAGELTAQTEALLKMGAPVRRPPRAYALAAVRETKEEAGLIVGSEAGPDLSKLTFVARAITPPHRTRRFDARFFQADAERVLLRDEPDAGDEELLDTRWFPIEEALALDLPSITRFVLKEVEARLAGDAVAPPFLRWYRGAHRLDRLSAEGE